RRKIEELECASFGDESHIIYVNGSRRDNTPLGKLMQDFFEPDAEKIHYKELANRVDYFKGKEQGVSAMCDLMENFLAKREAKALEEGRIEGRVEEQLRSIKMLMQNLGMTAQAAMDAIGIDKATQSHYLARLSVL
ncbi:MAG: hypothetical protein IJ934_02560, partial [Acetobacter sp.]|nr:hypothetical protein [Acetobacter sp.]